MSPEMLRHRANVQNACRDLVNEFDKDCDSDAIALRMMQAACREYYIATLETLLDDAASCINGFRQLYDPHCGQSNRLLMQISETLSRLNRNE